MASKEATVYIVDMGTSMKRERQGREVTDLEWAMEYVWDKITATVATERKTAHVGLIGLKTDETQNELDSEDAYQNISVLQSLGQILMPDLRRLRSDIRPSTTDNGDAISALVIAIQMITSHCRQLQYVRRIVLVTNGESGMDTSDMENITSKVKSDGMELTILGIDFDDPDYGFKEEDKDALKSSNEAALRNLAEECNGAFGTLAQAIDELGIPRLKTVRPVHSFKGYLTLGNPEDYDTAMAIDVERYPKTMLAKAPTASSFVVRQDMAPVDATQSTHTLTGEENQDGLAAVKNARTYQVPDEQAPGGKRDVEQEELAKGYAYGSTAVYISESDRNVTTYETKPGLDIVGFVAKEQYERYMDMSRANMIVAQRTNDKANMALSSFIHALYELDSYAIARLVVKENKQPLMLVLAPSIEPDLECLYDFELPFAEDVRSYRFPALDRVVTVSGKTLKQHRNLPTADLQSAMDSYVDAMDLSSFGRDDSDQPAEYMPIEDTFSPVLHRVNQVIRHRAIHPNAPIPAIPATLTKYSSPPSSLLESAQPHLTAIQTSASLKKVPPKLRGKRNRRETEKPISGLDVNSLLHSDAPHNKYRRSASKIDPTNAIPEFKQMLASVSPDTDEGVTLIHSAAKQLGECIRTYIRTSVGDSGYGRAIEALRVLREEMLDLEEPGAWNAVVRGLKRDVFAEELGGDRREMWYLIRRNRLGLIGKSEVGVSDVREEDAKSFLSGK